MIRSYILELGLVAVALPGCTRGASAEAGDSASMGDSAAGAYGPATRAVSLPVAVAEVRKGDLVLSISTTGQVRAEGEATLKSEVSGTIQAVLVRPGERVKRGQPLIRLDPRPFDLNVKEAEAAAAEAELRYVDAIAPDSIVLGRSPTDEQRRIALVRAGLPAARVRLERAKLERERSVIAAPFDGMVDRVEHAKGERVQPGETLTRVVNLNTLRVEASVLEHDLPLIRQGGLATITSASVPHGSVSGRVSAVLPVIDSVTRAGRVFVRIPIAAALRPGMYADVKLEAQRLENRVLVPSRAVIERDGRPLVFVVKEGRAQWVYINAGRSNGIETEVLPDPATGLIPIEVGDHVIVEGHLTLTHDAQVREVLADTARGAGRR